MKFYFNANNTTQLKALRECGIKNVLISYKYLKNQFGDICRNFNSVMMVAGKIDNVDKYYDYIDVHDESMEMAVQYDVPMDMYSTIKYYEKGRGKVAPVLTVNYLNHIGQLKLKPNDYVCLGKMAGRIEEEEQIKKLPTIYKLHGLAKGRLIRHTALASVDSSAWLSGVRGRKTEVFDSTPLTFGHKGKSDVAMVQRICEKYKDNLDRCGINPKPIADGDYSALLKIVLAVYYIPMFDHLGVGNENLS